MAREPNPNPKPSPTTIHSFEPRTLILNLLLVLLLASPYLTHSSPSPAPSPFPSPSPSPLPPRTPPKHLDADHTGLRIPPPRPPPPPPPPSYRRSHQRGVGRGGVPVAPREGRRLNNGQKIGLLFTGIAIVMQVGFVGFLVFKRWQLKKMERGDRAWESSSSAPLT